MQPLSNTTSKSTRLDSTAANMEIFSEHTFDKRSGFSRIKNTLVFLFLVGSCAFALYAYVTRPNEVPAVDAVLELQHITHIITEDDDWDLNRINLIFYHWGNLSKNQQQQIKQTTWFAQFAKSLSEHLKRNRYLDSLEKAPDNNIYDLLNTLAVVIDAPNIKVKYAKSEPITKIMRDKVVKIQDQAEPVKKQVPTTQQTSKNTARSENDVSLANIAQTNVVQRTIKQESTPAPQIAAAEAAPSRESSDQDDSDPYGAIAVKHADSKKEASPKTDIVKEKSLSSKQPASVELTKPLTEKRQPDLLAKSNPMLPAAPTLHRSKVKDIAHPTPAELDYVINQYIDGYEKGNVNKILGLLSLNAKTSAQSNAKEIGSYLNVLFSTTKDRQLFIRNVKWKYEGNIAKGIGDIHTLLLPEQSTGEIVSAKGKIQIIAKKVNNSILITHMYSTDNPR